MRELRKKVTFAIYAETDNLDDVSRIVDELLDLDEVLWDYVIVHELLHFFVPNHGKLWKSLMRAHLGDYEASESRLKRLNSDRSS